MVAQPSQTSSSESESHLSAALAHIPPNAPARMLGLLLAGVTDGMPKRLVEEDVLPHTVSRPVDVPEDWRERADARSKSEFGVSDEDLAAADAFESELDEHNAWGLCFFGWSNAAGYGYTDDHDTNTVAVDGWNAYSHFASLPYGAQTAIAVRALMGDTDADRVSAWHFMKHNRSVTWDVDYR